MPERSDNALGVRSTIGPLRTQRDVLTFVGNHRTVAESTPPAEQAVTLAEAQSFMGISAGTDDALITSLIKGCQNVIEGEIGQKLITQTLQLVLDQFDAPWTDISSGPVASITSVTVSGALVDSSRYRLINGGAGPKARLIDYGAGLPSPTEDFAGIVVLYVTGYGAAADVPEHIKNALLWYVQVAYDDPDATLPKVSRNFLQPELPTGRV